MAPNKAKNKDFQKTKFKVGKTKPKPANYTNTSFKAKRITIKQQSLRVDAPSQQSQFEHRVSLLSSASEKQRKESLSWIEEAVTNKTLTWNGPSLLDKLLPLLQDANGSVRDKLVKTLQAFPKEKLKFLAEKILLHINVGITNININIRVSALKILDWAIETYGVELVESRGGWFNMLKTFLVILHCSTTGESSSGWTTNVALVGDTKYMVRVLDTLTAFLRLGMTETASTTAGSEPREDWWNPALKMHTQPDPYKHLNLYGRNSKGDHPFTRDVAHRKELFLDHYRSKFEASILELRKQGGEAGRAAAKTSSVIVEAMIEADKNKELYNNWVKKMEAKDKRIRDHLSKYGFSGGPSGSQA